MSSPDLTIMLCAGVVTVATIVAAVYDLRYGIIPDWLTYGLFGAVCLFYAVLVMKGDVSGGRALVHVTIGVIASAGPALFLFAAGGMGGGDVKLLAGLGAWLGWQQSIELLVAVVLLASLQAIVTLAVRGRLRALFGNVLVILANATRRPEQRRRLDAGSMFELRLAPAISVGFILVCWG